MDQISNNEVITFATLEEFKTFLQANRPEFKRQAKSWFNIESVAYQFTDSSAWYFMIKENAIRKGLKLTPFTECKERVLIFRQNSSLIKKFGV